MKGTISLNDLGKIITKKSRELSEEIPKDIEVGFYEEARKKIFMCEKMHEVWIEAIKKR